MKLLVKKEELCIGCGACEEACSKAFFKENNREKSCVQIEAGQKNTINTCNQCGVCIDICPIIAIKRDAKGVVKIDKKECVGCFMCVGFCPEEAMRQHDDYIEPFKCIACGICVKQCPTGALAIEDVEIETKERFS